MSARAVATSGARARIVALIAALAGMRIERAVLIDAIVVGRVVARSAAAAREAQRAPQHERCLEAAHGLYSNRV
jgi:hypothetical protein